MSEPLTTADIQSRVAQTRAQLESTLDEIEDKLNVPKQLGIFASKLRARFDENPTPFVTAAAGAMAVLAGIVVWAAVSRD